MGLWKGQIKIRTAHEVFLFGDRVHSSLYCVTPGSIFITTTTNFGVVEAVVTCCEFTARPINVINRWTSTKSEI